MQWFSLPFRGRAKPCMFPKSFQFGAWDHLGMIVALVNPPGLKSFSGLQMHTPNPPLGLAYVAAAIKEAGIPYLVIDGTGEALDAVSPYPLRTDFMIQGLAFE